MKNKLLKIAVPFGIAAGFACFAFFVALYLLDVQQLWRKRMPDIGLNLILIFSSIWYFKRQTGELRFWQGLILGFINYLVAAFVSGILLFIFVNFIAPETFTQLIAEGKMELDRLVKDNNPNFKLNYKMAYQNLKDTKPTDVFLGELSNITKFVFVAFVTFLTSAILRTRPVQLPISNE